MLAQALDPRVPLLERLKFLCISSSNLDEFFEIRVAGLKQLLELGGTQTGSDGLVIADQLSAIHEHATGLVHDQYACLNDVLLPGLAEAGIEVLDAADWDEATRQWVEHHFAAEVEPVLSPLGLDPARPFPRIQNKSLNFIVRLSGKDAYGRDSELAVVQAPRSLPRIVALPDGGGRRRFVALSTIVEAFVPRLFKGVQVLGCYQFRVTRNSDLFVDDEEVDDLRRALEGELAQRRYGAAVRLEIAASCPVDMVEYLLQRFSLTRARLLSRPRSGQSQSPLGGLRYRPASGPQVPALHTGAAGAPARRDRSVRRDPPARRAATPSLPQLRSRHGSAAPGSR